MLIIVYINLIKFILKKGDVQLFWKGKYLFLEYMDLVTICHKLIS